MPLRVSVKTAINFPLGNDNDLFKLKLQNLVLIKNFHSINNMYKYYMPLRVSVKTAINFPLENCFKKMVVFKTIIFKNDGF